MHKCCVSHEEEPEPEPKKETLAWESYASFFIDSCKP